MRRDEMMITAIGSTGMRPALDAVKKGLGHISVANPSADGETKASAPTAVATMVSEGAPIDTSRIAAIKAAIAGGGYRIDPGAIARAMIATDLPAVRS